MKAHRYAKYFPLMDGEEFDDLVNDIREHGLLEPIVTFEEAILDGRNRFRACKKAGVEPRFTKYRGNGVITYIISKNVHRRHLSVSQRAVIALDVLPVLEKEAAKRNPVAQRIGRPRNARRGTPTENGTSTAHAGRMLRVGGSTVRQAKRIAKEAPELLPAIRAGRKTVHEAEQEVRQRKARVAVKRETARQDHKKRENPREVKEYLDAIRTFCDAARTAKKVAAYGKFSPEAQRFVTRQHGTVCELLAKIEEAF